jgi:hypothetical protein
MYSTITPGIQAKQDQTTLHIDAAAWLVSKAPPNVELKEDTCHKTDASVFPQHWAYNGMEMYELMNHLSDVYF